MYQISIYNNEPVFLEYLSILITKIMLSLDIPCRIHTFQNAKELTDFFTEGNYPPPGTFEPASSGLRTRKRKQRAACRTRSVKAFESDQLFGNTKTRL